VPPAISPALPHNHTDGRRLAGHPRDPESPAGQLLRQFEAGAAGSTSPGTGLPEGPGVDLQDRAPDPAPGWRAVRRSAVWRVRLGTAALWTLIALAAAGGLRGLAGAPGPATAAPPAAVDPGTGGFAAQFVTVYLDASAGQEDSLRPFYRGAVDLSAVPAGRYVSHAAAVASQPLAPGYWAVTVAADLLVAVPGGYRDEGTSYYQVGLFRSPSGLVATGLPSLVAAPAAGTPPALELPAPSSPPAGPVGAVLTAFLQGFLTPQGRAANAGAAGSVRPPSPPPFAAVTVTAVTIGPAAAKARAPTTRLARVRVEAADGAGQCQLLDYTLRLADRPDGWQVQTILPAAPLAP
jgi:hypothetical protein